jgi:hypothetical protein
MVNRLLMPLLVFAVMIAHAAPPSSDQLELRNTMQFAADVGIEPNSMFNPRYFDGDVHVTQINTPAFGRYRSGSSGIRMFVNNTAINWEHRMVAPFRGANSSVYLLGSSGANNNTTLFTRYDFNGENPADEPVPGEGQGAEGFDWVNDDTIIYTTYNPTSSRRRLALAQIEAEPFVILSDPRWNANGFIETTATTRIRNVRVGDHFVATPTMAMPGRTIIRGFSRSTWPRASRPCSATPGR